MFAELKLYSRGSFQQILISNLLGCWDSSNLKRSFSLSSLIEEISLKERFLINH
jgi:hypothetical protein